MLVNQRFCHASAMQSQRLPIIILRPYSQCLVSLIWKVPMVLWIADIPGLIVGAADGIGLGHEFLRHIERTKVFIHMVDAASTEGRDPLNDINIINQELKKYSEELAARPHSDRSDIKQTYFMGLKKIP